MGYQFGEYFKRVVEGLKILVAYDDMKKNFLDRFGEKKIIKLVFEEDDGMSGGVIFVDENGILKISVRRWMSGVHSMKQKLENFLQSESY